MRADENRADTTPTQVYVEAFQIACGSLVVALLGLLVWSL